MDALRSLFQRDTKEEAGQRLSELEAQQKIESIDIFLESEMDVIRRVLNQKHKEPNISIIVNAIHEMIDVAIKEGGDARSLMINYFPEIFKSGYDKVEAQILRDNFSEVRNLITRKSPKELAPAFRYISDQTKDELMVL